jgi:hypothetical protein
MRPVRSIQFGVVPGLDAVVAAGTESMRRQTAPTGRVPGEGRNVLHAPRVLLHLARQIFVVEALDLVLVEVPVAAQIAAAPVISEMGPEGNAAGLL